MVYDDISPFFVAKVINHEIGHLHFRDHKLSVNAEEARVRKVVETEFLKNVFGDDWLRRTTSAVSAKVVPVEKNGRVYNGFTPAAVQELHDRIRSAGIRFEETALHNGILETMVFILTNSEENLAAALDAGVGVIR